MSADRPEPKAIPGHERSVWITGARGLIGSHLAQAAAHFAPGWRVLAPTRQELDLTDLAAVTAFFRQWRPSLVMHCAALTSVAVCQSNQERAHLENTAVTRHLSGLAEPIQFLFFSTDLVFDGRRGCYSEEDPVNPLSCYGETKAEAERCVLRNPRHAVLRTSLNAGISRSGDRSFSERMRLAWVRGETLSLFTDEYRSPIPVSCTAQAAWETAIDRRAGLFHLAGSERLSRWQMGQLFAQRWSELSPKITPASIRDFAGPARPGDTSLDCARIQPLLSFRLPGLSEWVGKNPGEV